EAGVPVKVYGPDWSAYIPEENVVAPFVPLDALPEMYERASVVLNDQWAEMREAGFPAMRPFDVIAAGGRVVSEEVDGLREALGPGVVTYRSEAELV
uniref:glycosyltransferase family protein n=1 Tax=Escherichia coli TaxID=562 RepID=UPI00278C17F6